MTTLFFVTLRQLSCIVSNVNSSQVSSGVIVYFIIINRLLHIVCYVVCQQILSKKTEHSTHTSMYVYYYSGLAVRPLGDWYRKKTGLNIGKWSKCYALTSSKKVTEKGAGMSVLFSHTLQVHSGGWYVPIGLVVAFFGISMTFSCLISCYTHYNFLFWLSFIEKNVFCSYSY